MCTASQDKNGIFHKAFKAHHTTILVKLHRIRPDKAVESLHEAILSLQTFTELVRNPSARRQGHNTRHSRLSFRGQPRQWGLLLYYCKPRLYSWPEVDIIMKACLYHLHGCFRHCLV